MTGSRLLGWILFALVLGLPACGGGGGGSGAPPLSGLVPASQVLGQADFTGAAANRGGMAEANSFDCPLGLDAGSLYVADWGNNRLLGFNDPIVGNGPSANFVIGQPDLTSTAPGTTSSSFNLPHDVLVAGGRLFVADTGNNRVLIWNSVPMANAPADVVLGQADFTSNAAATTQAGMNAPLAVAVAGTRLFVADGSNNRVLIWNTIPTTNGAAADVVLGQADFTSGASATGAAGLNFPFDLWTDGARLIVSDNGNHRLLIWNTLPTTNAAPANVVVGQPDFTTVSPGTGAQKLDTPSGIDSDGSRLYIADNNNHRVIIHDVIPTTNGRAADRLLGQSTFTNVTENDDDQDGVEDASPSARTMKFPYGVEVVGSRIYVSDPGNHRILVFP